MIIERETKGFRKVDRFIGMRLLSLPGTKIIAKLVIFLLFQAQIAMALDLSREKADYDSIEDRRSKTSASPSASPSASQKVSRKSLNRIVFEWRAASKNLIYQGRAAERGVRPFVACPVLKAGRPHFVKIKNELENPRLDANVSDLARLDSTIKQSTETLISTADMCNGGFAAIEEQLATHEKIILNAKNDYKEASSKVVQEVLALDRTMENQKATPDGPGSCATFTDTAFAKVGAFAAAHNSIKKKLDSYLRDFERRRQVLKKAKTRPTCDSPDN